MVLYGALSSLTSRAVTCAVTEKLALVSPCSMALCHTIASIKVANARVSSKVTQKMVREANREAEFAEIQEERRKNKHDARRNKRRYDYTNPAAAGSRATNKVRYQKRLPLVDVEEARADDGTQEPDSANASKGRVSKLKDHIYYNIYPWTTVTELAEHLVRTKIYEDKHYLVLNKPVGVLQDHPLKTSGARCYGRPPPITYSLADAIPIMKEITGALNLKICHAPEKWNSGVTVLAKHSTAQHIAMYECRSTAKQRGISNKQFWALTRYSPQPVVQPCKRVGCMLEHFEDTLVPVFTKKVSKTSNKRGTASAFNVDHTTLASSLDTGMALVQSGVSSTKWFALRVWLSHCLAPVLGDHLLGGRVGELMGQPVPVPYSRASRKQNLNYEVLQRLDLSPSLQDLLPLFIHLRTVRLPDYHSIVENVKEERRLKYPKDDPYYGDDLEMDTVMDLREEEGEDRGLLRSGEGILQRDDGGRGYKNEGRAHDSLNKKGGVAKRGLVEDGDDDLVFTAPLPEHFLWTMERLGIPLETDDNFGY